MISDLVKEAAAAGLDPAAAWWRTPGELLEIIEAYRTRMERKAYMLYNLASATAAMVGKILGGGRSPQPWECFPGWIQASMQIMSDEEILAAAEAWASLGEHSELPEP